MQKIIEYFTEEDFLIPYIRRMNKKASWTFLDRVNSQLIIENTRVGTLIVATIYLQLIQNIYMFRSFTVLHCSRQHCVQPVASDVEVVEYL